MIADYIKYSIESLMHRKLRSWLTLIGIFIGIAAIVSLVSLGQGLRSAVTAQFEQLGTDKIIVQPGGEIGFPGTGAEAAKLTESEVRLIERIPSVDVAVEMQFGIGKAEFNDRNIFTYITGIPTDTKKMNLLKGMSSFKVLDGRMLMEGDGRKAQIGYLLATDESFFGKTLRVGNKINIEGYEFEIVGITNQIGNLQDDTQILIPLEEAEKIFNRKGKYEAIYLKVSEGADIDSSAEEIKKELRKSRGEKEGEEDFTVQTAQELLQSFGSILNIITAVLIGIAAISLLVGGIGIMNTMYTSVLERTNEIGVMKAIGARNSDILLIFLVESGVVGLAGGVIGIFLGIGFGKIAALFAAEVLKAPIIQASFPWYLIAGALAFSLLVGIASGLLPALQASKLKPADALRYE